MNSETPVEQRLDLRDLGEVADRRRRHERSTCRDRCGDCQSLKIRGQFIRGYGDIHGMSSSIRTEIGIGGPGGCPVAQASGDTRETISHITRSTAVNEDGSLTEEFTLGAEAALDQPGLETVFEYDSRTVYRFDRNRNGGCVCDRIERHGCPVSDLHARDGTLFVSFYAPDVKTIQHIVTDLHDWFDDIHVRQLTRADERTDHDFALVDRNRLTDRQREVLETSYEMGYFDYPKRANAGDVAGKLGIAPSTFSEHLAAAQRKFLETILQT